MPVREAAVKRGSRHGEARLWRTEGCSGGFIDEDLVATDLSRRRTNEEGQRWRSCGTARWNLGPHPAAQGIVPGSDVARFRLFIPLLVLFCCVLCGFLLLALILVLLTTFISHCMSPLLQARTNWIARRWTVWSCSHLRQLPPTRALVLVGTTAIESAIAAPLASSAASGAQLNREFENTSQVQNQLLRWLLIEVRASTRAASERHILALRRRARRVEVSPVRPAGQTEDVFGPLDRDGTGAPPRYRPPLRHTEGFLRSILALLRADLETPVHTTLSRRS